MSSTSSTIPPASDSGLVDFDYVDLSDMKWEEDWPNLKVPLSDAALSQLRNLRY